MKPFIDLLVILQPLQSINLAQERSAEQEQQARAEAAALHAKPSPVPSLLAPEVNSGALETSSNLALARHFQMQAQLQAPQLGAAGSTIQQQQLLSNPANLPGTGPVLDNSIVAAMATHPEAYQQLLNSMLAQQGRPASGAMPPGPLTTGGMLYAQPSAVFDPYGGSSVANPSTQYPQGLGSMPMEARRWLAAQVAAAATGSTRQELMPDMHMMPQAPAVLHSSHAMPPMHHGSLHKMPPDQQPVAVPPSNWGWPTGSIADLHSMGLTPGFQSQAEFLAAQAQDMGRAAAFQPGNLENQQLPFGGEQRWVSPLCSL